MTTKKGSTKRPAKDKANAEEMETLAHHLSEALRIMRTSEVIPSRVYNDFAEAYNDLTNYTNEDELIHSEPYIRLHLLALVEKGDAE